MTREFRTGINLNKNELLNAKVHSAASAPSSPVAGQLWYDSTNNLLKFYNGSSWVSTGGGGGSSANFFRPFTPGYRYNPHNLAGTSTGNMTAGRQYFIPMMVPTSTTFDRMLIRTGGTFSGTATMRLGIYNDDGFGRPSTVKLDAGTISATASSTNYEITIDHTCATGFYWIAVNTQTAATTNNWTTIGNSVTVAAAINGGRGTSLDNPGQNGSTFWHQNSITGAFATVSNLLATSVTDTYPIVVQIGVKA